MDGEIVCKECGRPFTKGRSSKANNRYWAILRQASLETGHTPEELHEICKATFNKQTKELFGGAYDFVGSTAWLDQADFKDYVDQVELWFLENGFDIVLSEDSAYLKEQ